MPNANNGTRGEGVWGVCFPRNLTRVIWTFVRCVGGSRVCVFPCGAALLQNMRIAASGGTCSPTLRDRSFGVRCVGAKNHSLCGRTRDFS